MAPSQNIYASKTHHICKSDGVKALLERPLFCPNFFWKNVAVLTVQFDVVVLRMIKHRQTGFDIPLLLERQNPACQSVDLHHHLLLLHDIDIIDTSLIDVLSPDVFTFFLPTV